MGRKPGLIFRKHVKSVLDQITLWLSLNTSQKRRPLPTLQALFFSRLQSCQAASARRSDLT